MTFQSTKVDKLYQHFLALQQVLAWRFGHVFSERMVAIEQDINRKIHLLAKRRVGKEGRKGKVLEGICISSIHVLNEPTHLCFYLVFEPALPIS